MFRLRILNSLFVCLNECRIGIADLFTLMISAEITPRREPERDHECNANLRSGTPWITCISDTKILFNNCKVKYKITTVVHCCIYTVFIPRVTHIGRTHVGSCRRLQQRPVLPSVASSSSTGYHPHCALLATQSTPRYRGPAKSRVLPVELVENVLFCSPRSNHFMYNIRSNV